MRRLSVLSVILAAIMMMSAVCVHVSAAEADQAESGALNNYLFGYMSWGVKHMGLDVLQEKLENSGRELPEVLVAVIDSGINTSNILLKGRYTDGYNFINNTTDFEDEDTESWMYYGNNWNSNVAMPALTQMNLLYYDNILMALGGDS